MSGNIQKRRNWSRSLTMVILLAAAAAIVGSLTDNGAVATDRVYLQASAGAVLFDHGEHSTVADSCVVCHHNVTEDDDPESCRECHRTSPQSDVHTVSCTECHDDESYTPDLMEHDEYLEIEDHACMECHSPRSLSQVYHINCTNCHLENAPERFADDGGAVTCGACHLR